MSLLIYTLKAREKLETSQVGPLHSMWDVVFDAEALLEGKETLVNDREIILQYLKDFVDES